MAPFHGRERRHFPLTSIASVVELFREQLEGPDEPNLALLSIVLGCVENTLTLNRSVTTSNDDVLRPIFPVVDWETVDALYSKFEALVKGSVDLTKYPSGNSTRELVKKVSDVIWGSLSRNFKDRAHLQSLYSFLTGNKLDCFGVAFGVVAAAQLLGLKDLHLALSEDHAWVVFGRDSTDTAEVTWHGKGNEDKRGQSIALSVAEKSWLYLNGHPIVCDRLMEVSAIVSSLNPGINVSMDSIEMGALQQELLWLLYDRGHLSRYPMALGNLGDLEEITPTPGRPPPLAIFQEAISSSVKYYNNHHVYPYTYLGGFFYRKRNYKQAIKCWADATNVIKQFNYTREDIEIYKEFLEIANELIPNIVKAVSANTTDRVQMNILYNPEVYADVLRFYDGICQWEEGSSTPVLHVGWAQNLTFSLNKFDSQTRAKIDLGKDEDSDGDDDDGEDNDGTDEFKSSDKQTRETKDVGNSNASVLKLEESLTGQRETPRGRKGPRRRNSSLAKNANFKDAGGSDSKLNGDEQNKVEHKIKSTIEELASKIVQQDCSLDAAPNPNITALALQCSVNILNKDYLLGAGEPFSSSPAMISDSSVLDESLTSPLNTDSSCNGSAEHIPNSGLPERSSDENNDTSSNNTLQSTQVQSPSDSPTASVESVHVELHSEKMKGLKKMFKSSKLNACAIKLQLTAQSQVHVKDSRFLDFGEPVGSARKRQRREIV
ncbi:unnamed protein product [Candidula unifasciata]|uniref:Menin n=1 Tax=Candidula unifasciata TaxID=100452 RepID=A0A8S3ZB43_9EUPU|nr:unnamed protein product [Candidula unifasciata]